MKTREQLQEEYGDALFALLMYDLAAEEGRRALEENERLQNDPNAEVPKDVQQRDLQLINRIFFKKKLLRLAKRTGLLAAILLVGCLLIRALMYLINF